MTNNSKHLIKYKKSESLKKSKAVKEAISYLLYCSEEINVNKVARKAQVSRTFIYENPELRTLIESSKDASKLKAEKKRISSGRARSDESKMAIISNLKRSLKDANNQIVRLKTENTKLRSYISKIEDE